MQRMMGLQNTSGSSNAETPEAPEAHAIINEDVESCIGEHRSIPQWAEVLRSNADSLLRTVLPIIWCILFVGFMDRESFLRNMFMPFLGVFAALLANCVPIGGGIVYVPALALLSLLQRCSLVTGYLGFCIG